MSKKFRRDGSYLDVDAEAHKLQWSQHSNGEVVRMGSCRFLEGWVESRKKLPLTFPEWDEDARKPEDSWEMPEGNEELVEVDASSLGHEVVSRRLVEVARRNAGEKILKQKDCEEDRLLPLKPCTCKQPIHAETCPHSWTSKYNTMITYRAQQKLMLAQQACAEHYALKVAKRRRTSTLDALSNSVSDVERCAATLMGKSEQYQFEDDKLVQVPGECFGQRVFTLVARDTGRPRFDIHILPLKGSTSPGARWMLGKLDDWCVTTEQFFDALRLNKFCIDYTILFLHQCAGISSEGRDKKWRDYLNWAAQKVVPISAGFSGHELATAEASARRHVLRQSPAAPGDRPAAPRTREAAEAKPPKATHRALVGVYSERQKPGSETCGMHAVNHILQRAAFDEKTFRDVHVETAKDLLESAGAHGRKDGKGDWSIEVIGRALRKHMCNMAMDTSGKLAKALKENGVLGLLLGTGRCFFLFQLLHALSQGDFLKRIYDLLLCMNRYRYIYIYR